MKRVTYRPGVYSQVLLLDGARIFVQVRPMSITVRRMLLGGLIPGKLLWEFPVPFLIRQTLPTPGIGALMLEVVLTTLEACRSIADVCPRLDEAAVPALQTIIEKA